MNHNQVIRNFSVSDGHFSNECRLPDDQKKKTLLRRHFVPDVNLSCEGDENAELTFCYCRLCLVEVEEMDSIKIGVNENLLKRIFDCVQVIIAENDAFSQHICGQCMNNLNKWKEFKDKCQKSQKLLVEHANIKRQRPLEMEYNEQDMHQIDNLVKNPAIIIKEVKIIKKEVEQTNKNNEKNVCPTCGKTVLSTSWKHHQNLHSDKFKCLQCSKRFQAKAHLRTHIAGVHEKARNLICHICPKTFSIKESLQMHLLTHQKDRLYKCSLCSYSAYSSSNLKSHMNVHTNKVVYCDLCNVSCKGVRSLRDHKYRMHKLEKVYECDFCQRKFKQRFILQNHLLTHTGEKPYSCNKCSKSFARKTSLNKHGKLHQKPEKAFRCETCEKDCLSHSSLKKHICQENIDKNFVS